MGAEINPLCFPKTARGGRANLCPAMKDWAAKLIKHEAMTKVR